MGKLYFVINISNNKYSDELQIIADDIMKNNMLTNNISLPNLAKDIGKLIYDCCKKFNKNVKEENITRNLKLAFITKKEEIDDYVKTYGQSLSIPFEVNERNDIQYGEPIWLK